MLDIPVLNILAWSSPSPELNSVGTEYVLMERVNGRQLSDVWATLSKKQRFGLVENLIEIEKKLVNTRFTGHGSLY